MNLTKSFFSNPLISVQGHGWPEPLLAAQSSRSKPTLDRTPFHHRVTCTPTPTQTGPARTCPSTWRARLWDVGGRGEPGDNPCRHGENIQTPQTAAPTGNNFFNQHRSERMLNETTLFKELLHKENLFFVLTEQVNNHGFKMRAENVLKQGTDH